MNNHHSLPVLGRWVFQKRFTSSWPALDTITHRFWALLHINTFKSWRQAWEKTDRREKPTYSRIFLDQFEIVRCIELIVEHSFLIGDTITFHFPRNRQTRRCWNRLRQGRSITIIESDRWSSSVSVVCSPIAMQRKHLCSGKDQSLCLRVYAFVDGHEIWESLESSGSDKHQALPRTKSFIRTRSAVISLLSARRILCRVIRPTLIFGNLNQADRSIVFLRRSFVPIEHFTEECSNS